MILPVRADKLTFKNRETGEITYRTKITYLVRIDKNEYVCGYDVWESYTSKSLSVIEPFIDKKCKAVIRNIKEGNRYRPRLEKIENVEL